MNAPQNLEFSMPMFRKSVPERIRPFIYLAFGIIFQLTSGVYLGSMASMKGELSMMQEDIMMCGYAGFIGLTMPFPLLIVIAVLQLFTVNFRPGKPFPLYGIDWTGLVLWTFLLLELSFVFIYGEHYNWLDGKPIRYTLAAAAVTAGFCFGRMRKVRHPYIEVKSWT